MAIIPLYLHRRFPLFLRTILITVNSKIKEISVILYNRLIILLTIFSAFAFVFQFILIRTDSDYLYTELQKSHFKMGSTEELIIFGWSVKQQFL